MRATPVRACSLLLPPGSTRPRRLGLQGQLCQSRSGLTQSLLPFRAVPPCSALESVLKLLCIRFVLLVPSWYCTLKLRIGYLV